MKNKKGQDVSPLPVVISIILLLGVAVVLILGFTRGWQTFAFWLPSNNVQTVVTQCNIACSQQNSYDFCTLPRTLNDPAQKNKPGFDANGVATKSCHALATDTNYGSYKIPDCTGMPCQ